MAYGNMALKNDNYPKNSANLPRNIWFVCGTLAFINPNSAGNIQNMLLNLKYGIICWLLKTNNTICYSLLFTELQMNVK